MPAISLTEAHIMANSRNQLDLLDTTNQAEIAGLHEVITKLIGVNVSLLMLVREVASMAMTTREQQDRLKHIEQASFYANQLATERVTS